MRELRGDRISMIFQEPMTSLNPAFTIGDQIVEGIVRHRPASKPTARALALEMLRRVHIPSPEQRFDDYPHRLSGGMRQRVMIAMALACKPALLIADEPTTALDVTVQAQILDLMRQLRHETGTAIILITHDLGVVAELADDVVVMYAGRIVESASVAALVRRAAASVYGRTAGLDPAAGPRADPAGGDRGAGAESDGADRGLPLPSALPVRVRTLPSRGPAAAGRGRWPPVGVLARAARPRSLWCAGMTPIDGPVTAPLLQVAGLVKHFPLRKGFFRRDARVVRAVDGIDFDLAAGETLALVGESGCGKSTTGRLLLRLIEPTAGSVRFDGQELFALDAEAMRAQRRALQIIFQDPYASLNPRMTVAQTVGEPLALYDLASGRRRDRVAELLGLVGLAPQHAERYPHEFSGGQRQRIGIARALAVEPRLIVCDEPVSALDVSIQAQVINLLMDLQQRLGLAYVFIAHDLAVVKHIAARVAVMYLGRIVEYAPTRELFARPRHPYTQALLSAIPVPAPGARAQRMILAGRRAQPDRPARRAAAFAPAARTRSRAAQPKRLRSSPKPGMRSPAISGARSRRPPAAFAAGAPAAAGVRLTRLQQAFRARLDALVEASVLALRSGAGSIGKSLATATGANDEYEIMDRAAGPRAAGGRRSDRRWRRKPCASASPKIPTCSIRRWRAPLSAGSCSRRCATSWSTSTKNSISCRNSQRPTNGRPITRR